MAEAAEATVKQVPSVSLIFSSIGKVDLPQYVIFYFFGKGLWSRLYQIEKTACFYFYTLQLLFSP